MNPQSTVGGLELYRRACRLLAFDLLTANGDRTALNPNVAWNGTELFVFDFEHALELPGTEAKEAFEMQLRLLANLRATHMFGGLAGAPEFRSEIEYCVKRIADRAAALQSVDELPNSWRSHWQWLTSYFEYVGRWGDDIFRRATADP